MILPTHFKPLGLTRKKLEEVGAGGEFHLSSSAQGLSLRKRSERRLTGAEGKTSETETAEGAGGFPVSSSSPAAGHPLNIPPPGREEGPRKSRAGGRRAGLPEWAEP